MSDALVVGSADEIPQLPKEPFGDAGISKILNEDVDHIPVLVDGAPEIVTLSSDSHEHFVQVPDVALSALATSEVLRVFRSELHTPLAYGLVADDDSAFCQEVFDVSEAQAKPMVQPNAVADDIARGPVAAVDVRIRFRPRSPAGTG